MITTKNNEHKKLNFSSEREQGQACLNSAEHEKNQGRKVLNVPNLRFPEFQEEWSVTTLQKDCIVNPTNEKIADKFVYVDLESVKQGQLYKYQILTKGSAPSRAQRVLHTDDILFQCVRPYQMNNYMVKETMSDIQWVASTGYAQIRTQTDYPAFLYYVLNTSKYNKAVMVRCTGSSYPAINSEDLSKIPFYKCGITEQKKIADFLSLLDERIATQNKIIDKLQSLIKGLNDSLYAQYGDKVLTSFAELGTSYSGLSGKSAQDFGSGKPFITYLNVYSNNIINENDFQYVAIKNGEKQNIVEYGDVLFTLSSETPEEVGIGSVYLGKEKVYLNSFCFGIHITNMEVAFPPYLSYYVSSTAFRKFIYPYAQGSTRFNLCKADFEKASIKLPTLENQKRIYSILSHIDSKIETEIQMLNLYNSQKQYLLRQMFI